MLSVLICTYNREKYIGPLLESIAANDLPKSEYEIVLVDNNCTDNTRGVCEAPRRARPRGAAGRSAIYDSVSTP